MGDQTVHVNQLVVSSKEQLMTVLEEFPSSFTDYEICRLREGGGKKGKVTEQYDFYVDNPLGFHAGIRCNIAADGTTNLSHKDAVREWIAKFEEKSLTSWIIDRSTGNHALNKTCNQKYVTFHEKFVCQFSRHNKISPSKRKVDKRTGCTRGGCRNIKCEAYITFRVFSVCKEFDSRKKMDRDGFYLARDKPLYCEIIVHYLHNHELYSHAALSLQKATPASKTAVRTLFSEGLYPADVLKHRRDQILSEGGQQQALASAAFIPSYTTVKNEHRKYVKEMFGSKTGSGRAEKFSEKMAELRRQGWLVTMNDEPFVAVIVCPFMIRAHSYHTAGDVVYIDSTGQLERGGTTCTLIATHTPCGCIPLGCAFHDGETEQVFLIVLSLTKELMGNNAFCSRGGLGPKCIMTDKCIALKNALGKVWPQAKQFLCSFHVVQAVRDWLKQTPKEKIAAREKECCSRLFYAILYSSFADIHENEQNLLKSCPAAFIDYYSRCWRTIKKEWVRSYRPASLHGSHTNNFIERLNRIIKENVLNRQREYNVVALSERIAEGLGNFFIAKLSSPPPARTLPRIKALFSSKIEYLRDGKDITCLSSHKGIFSVPSSNADIPYLVNGLTGQCTCSKSVGGHFCKHLAALLILKGIRPPNAPLITPEDHRILARIAWGSKAISDISFYTPLSENKKPDSQPICSSTSTTGTECLESSSTSEDVSASKDEAQHVPENDKEEMLASLLDATSDAFKFFNENNPSHVLLLHRAIRTFKNVKSPGSWGEKYAQFGASHSSYILRTSVKRKIGPFRIKPKRKKMKYINIV